MPAPNFFPDIKTEPQASPETIANANAVGHPVPPFFPGLEKPTTTPDFFPKSSGPAPNFFPRLDPYKDSTTAVAARGNRSGSTDVPMPDEGYHAPKDPTEGGSWVAEAGKSFGGNILNVLKTVGAVPTMLYSALSPGGALPGGMQDPAYEKGMEQWENLRQGISGFTEAFRKDPGEALRTGIGGIIAGEGGAELFRTGSPSKILENPGRTVGDLLFGAPMVAAPVFAAILKGASAVRGLPGMAPIVKGADVLGGKVIPKYAAPDSFLSIEAEHAGQLFSKTIKETKPLTVEAADAIARDPKAAPFIAPETNISSDNMVLLNKAIDKQWDLQQQMAQQRQPSDFMYHKHGLDVTVDKDGFISYGKASDYAKLDPETQRNILNIRTAIDTNHQELYNRGLITSKEYEAGSLGYTHDTYRLYHNPEDWINDLKTNPVLQPDLQSAVGFMMKNVRDPETGLKLNSWQAEDHVFDLLKHANDIRDGNGMPGTGYAALIQKLDIPEPIRGMLGRMEGKFVPVRVGETLDMQNKILLFDKMASKLANEVGHDGSPLLITNPSSDKVSRMYTYDGRPFKHLTEDAGQSNPIWGHRWGGQQVQVHPDIFDAIHTVANPEHIGAFTDAMQLWKAVKVPMNIPSHFNHSMGDMIFSGYGGKSMFNPLNWSLYQRTGKEIYNMWESGMTKTTPQIDAAMQLGVIRPGYGAVEAGSTYDKAMNPGSLNTFRDYAKWAFSPERAAMDQIGAGYDMERQWTRYGNWVGLMEDGMDPRAAALEIHKYYPSYSASSPVGNFLRGRSNLGPVGPGVGAFIGGPFTSFQMEAMRIHLTAAREHPWRFFAGQMIPMGITTLGMGATGMSPDEYYDMLRKQPDYQVGKTLIPWPTAQGKPGLVDWTHAFPGNEWAIRQKVGPSEIPGPGGLVFNGPGWALKSLYDNVDPHTGQPIIDTNKGETWANKGLPWILKQMLLPQSIGDVSTRVGAGLNELHTTRSESEPQDLSTAVQQGMLPQVFGAKPLEDLEKSANRTHRAEYIGKKQGLKGIGRGETLTPEETESRRETVRQGFERLREKN